MLEFLHLQNRDSTIYPLQMLGKPNDNIRKYKHKTNIILSVKIDLIFSPKVLINSMNASLVLNFIKHVLLKKKHIKNRWSCCKSTFENSERYQ